MFDLSGYSFERALKLALKLWNGVL